MIHQLRTYEIFEHNKAAFHARFRDHAWRLMKQYGFEILAFWESAEDNKTVFRYLLQWDDEASMDAAWTAFAANEEWKEIKRVTGAEHGDLVGDIAGVVLTPTDYSPVLGGGRSPASTFRDDVAAAQAEMPSVAPADVGEGALVIEVRDLADVKEHGTVDGAVPISLGSLGLRADVTAPDAAQHPELGDHDREIVVACGLGMMASLGAKKLRDLGYTNVTYIEGGVEAWREAGLPVDHLDE